MPDQRYLVTARKYRPQLFGELVAQEHVTETLKNAIRLDRLAHAYLFSGPRGVGKTTAARILAKAINCTTPLDERTDAAEPCRTCDSCKSFEEGRNLNIIEIDAASNNKVEDVRDLRDTVRIPPQGNRKKVYIIDEVHMLSTAAFNALLKTLEEPPPYVLFIFATTEPKKVLPTILSRCQRFDFRRIPGRETVSRLQEICSNEGITADEASLMLIARKGDGALRDALSALDQSVSLCGTTLQYDELVKALGVVDVDLFFEATRYVSNTDSAGMLRLVEHVTHRGYDLQEFLVGLAEHLRNLLVARTLHETSLIEATDMIQRRYAESCEQFTEADLLRLLAIVAETEDSIKNSTQPRLRLELAMLKMANLAHSADLRLALKKLEKIEAMVLDKGLPAAPRGSGSAAYAPAPQAGSDARVPQTAFPSRSSHEEQKPNPPPTSSRATAQNAARELSAPEKIDPDPSGDDEITAGKLAGFRTDVKPAAPTSPPSPTSSLGTSYQNVFSKPALAGKRAPSSQSPGSSDSPEAVAVLEEAKPEPGISGLLSAVKTCWPQFSKRVSEEKISIGALLKHTEPKQTRDGVVSVIVPDDFHKKQLEDSQAFLIQRLNEFLDGAVKGIEFVVSRQNVDAPAEETVREIDPYEYMQRKRENDPVIRAIFDKFGGELMY